MTQSTMARKERWLANAEILFVCLAAFGGLVFAASLVAKLIMEPKYPSSTVVDGVVYCCTSQPAWLDVFNYTAAFGIIIGAIGAVLAVLMRFLKNRAN